MANQIKQNSAGATAVIRSIQVVDPLVKQYVDEQLKAAEENFLKKAKEDLDKQIQAAQTLYVTIFGIFASIISLFTVEFQILKMCEGFHQIISLNLFLVASLLGFVLALDYVVTSKSQSRFVMLLIVVFVLFGLGIWFGIKAT